MHTGWNRLAFVVAAMVIASVGAASVRAADQVAVSAQKHRYIVEFNDPALASYEGGLFKDGLSGAQQERLEATSPMVTGAGKLDVRSPQAQAYLSYLDETHDAFRLDAAILLGRSIDPAHVYRNALNGMSLDLTADEAASLAASPWVKSLQKDRLLRPQTDTGPTWVGAANVWSGQSGYSANRGEGIVVGIIDSGANWDHPSFADPAQDGYNHVNPYGSQLGLCSKAEVLCNNKLVGVYDFVEDDASTTDVVEENTDGKDNSGHGSHVASTVAGNPVNVTLASGGNTDISGVAPRANIITYRVCFIGEPPDPDGGSCPTSSSIAAIDQAISDGVDVVNFSIGGSAFSPWAPGSDAVAFLNLRNAGVVAVTSAGNEGPNSGTIGSPANAPWLMAAGAATHNRIFGSIIQNMVGGATTPPGDLVGVSQGGGSPQRRIVHAKDFGFALCGEGNAELQSSCAANLGLSNPWKGTQPFNGEIVVCDRGTYGRIEKGKNVMQAGAGGFILANTELDGESIVSDEHCLPASHIGKNNGDKLRTWLATGTGHRAAISGFKAVTGDEFADQLADFSSRGPAKAPVQDVLKPNVIAPGVSILAASDQGQDLLIISGTSMASPHVAGAAALVRAVHPDWTVSQVVTALETTATAALAKDYNGTVATPHERGSGRIRVGEAVNAGLYLDVTGVQFSTANPNFGGNPRNLNLPGLVDTACQGSCSFTRTVTDQMGGGSWTAQAMNFPAGVQVSISPSNFTLANKASRELTITVNVGPSGIVGEWVYGNIALTAAGSSDQALTVAVYSSGGALPAEWAFTDKRDSGWVEFPLSDLAVMPDATFTSGGFVAKTVTTKTLKQDPTAVDPTIEKGSFRRIQNDDPFDGGEGVFTVWHNLPQGGLWVHAETLNSTSEDLDLWIGRDDNADGVADEDEQICASTSPTNIELCDLFNVPPGNYWVVVQNWTGAVTSGDEVTVVSAAVDASDHSPLVVSGPGIVGAGQDFSLRLSWTDFDGPSGSEYLGAVGIGTKRSSPNNVGVIPVYFTRNGHEAAQALPLMNGQTHKIGLSGGSSHSRMFVDVPDGVTSLNVAAAGADSNQNNSLKIELFRQDFSAALAAPPFVTLPGGLASSGSSTGSGGSGPGVTLNGSVPAGRYFVKLSNSAGSSVSAKITATMTSSASTLNPHRGLWDFDRGNAQGAEWNAVGAFNFAVWYAYDDAGQPTWYIASGASVTGNVWTADLARVTNDGSKQQESVVGKLSVTFIADNKMIFSYIVLGQAGFDTLHPNGPNTCPNISGGPKSYTGHWYRGVDGLGGSTVLVYNAAQAQVHYIYDSQGVPRWVLAADDNNQSATASVIPLLQFHGYCATCSPVAIGLETIGTVNRTFTAENSGNWTLDFDLGSPLNQSINRTDSVIKLSDPVSCE